MVPRTVVLPAQGEVPMRLWGWCWKCRRIRRVDLTTQICEECEEPVETKAGNVIPMLRLMEPHEGRDDVA